MRPRSTLLRGIALLVIVATATAVGVDGALDLHSSAAHRRRHRASNVARRATASTSGNVWPRDQCGWPYLYDGTFRNPPVTVTIGQGLLNYALAAAPGYEPLHLDGLFGPRTKAAVDLFQSRYAVKGGYAGWMDPVTWEALAAAAAGITPANAPSGSVVEAVQAGLTANGFAVNRTGLFDAATIVALQNFQRERGAAAASSSSVILTAQTWHLLVTECNSTGVFWFDAGWPQGKMSVEQLACLYHNASMRFAIFECWVEVGPGGSFWSECVGNILRARQAGFPKTAVAAYMFAQRFNADPALQVQQLLGNLSLALNVTNGNVSSEVPLVMLDIEGSKWSNYTQAENRAFILALRAAFDAAGVRIAVYCGAEWPDYFGSDFDAFNDVPVIYAHYDNVPSFYDYYPPYGGWAAPSGKQFWDGQNGERACGTGELDWDWSRAPFW